MGLYPPDMKPTRCLTVLHTKTYFLVMAETMLPTNQRFAFRFRCVLAGQRLRRCCCYVRIPASPVGIGWVEGIVLPRPRSSELQI